MYYREQQKLSESKVSRFTGFHPNARKTFAVLLHCIESAAIAHTIHRENFRDLSKINENCKAFLSRSFCCLRYIA